MSKMNREVVDALGVIQDARWDKDTKGLDQALIVVIDDETGEYINWTGGLSAENVPNCNTPTTCAFTRRPRLRRAR